MPEYGNADYWDDRYRLSDSDDPFDWLFSYDDIKDTLASLIPSKELRILMVGAGNAPFSPDM